MPFPAYDRPPWSTTPKPEPPPRSPWVVTKNNLRQPRGVWGRGDQGWGIPDGDRVLGEVEGGQAGVVLAGGTGRGTGAGAREAVLDGAAHGLHHHHHHQ
jgi:hypothetical protein